MDKYLEHLEYFFEADMEIKKILVSIAPSEMDDYSEEARTEYFDRLYKAIDTISAKLGRFTSGPFFTEQQFMDYKTVFPQDGQKPYMEYSQSEVPKTFRDKMELLRKQLLKCESLKLPLSKTYNACFAQMDDGLIKEVKEQIYGDNFNEQQRVSDLLSRATTVNEILHILHFHVENNKEILQSLPILDRKESPVRKNDGSMLVGYDSNSLAREIFDRYELPQESAFAYTVALKGKTMMMVRDAGHALTMQITENEDGTVKVEYFIPKVTDADIVTHLPVDQQSIDYETQTAIGTFTIPRVDASKKICSFIDKVPGDTGMLNRELLSRIFEVNGDEEKVIRIIEDGLISPRNMLLPSNINLTGIRVTDEFKKRVLYMAEAMEKEKSDKEICR